MAEVEQRKAKMIFVSDFLLLTKKNNEKISEKNPAIISGIA